MHRMNSFQRSGRGVIIGLALMTLPVGGIVPTPASALIQATCCLCAACLPPDLAFCAPLDASSCEETCGGLCFSVETVNQACTSIPTCAQFTPPAAAPALAPAGLGLGAIVLAAFGWRAMRRRR